MTYAIEAADALDEATRRRDEVCSGRVKPIPAEEVYRRIARLLEK